MNADKLKAALAGHVVQKETFTVLDSEGNTIHVERDVVIKWSTIEEILEMAKQFQK
ncbi:hypothetical protein Ab1vBOLIVR2_gp65 [Agrobacterium phage OLIVR2]|uniref:Uncharacterized protein n=1 Tax=Agrobacterium phage OLIVR1 TaxID=2723769 RepID=A0A858MU37_9CAUD|nr:hypothetical protein [Xanthomonas campestris]YP_010107099.1 hypothetical protein KNU98_gp044 [Agrobacterium phage OLIVR1]QIW87368.1 hypothetical protein Ab1vBOLIVR2_gp65 [Agrobacterium phage OLIVR2]QIW87475.1 hypothetical protein Ab1vBOLIVR3_gp65 [Agrobacterium phage OLIVR3]MCF8861647.1 hypothetical protein [Xanthomonas campestris pv. campestris]QIW87260.1 hypothetical protein Ab1vBOLIVR1_gp65 [Agrobacterium phage OLIVR1]